MKTAMRRSAGLLAVCALAGGCTVLGPVDTPARFFTLSALPPAASVAGARADGLVYGLGPVSVPPYLGRNEIATRVSATEVSYSDVDRWAESLRSEVASVLLQNLCTLLDTDRVVSYPWAINISVDYQVEVSLLRFERDTAGEIRLSARWMIKEARSGRYLVDRQTDLRRPSPPADTAAAVAALSAALGDLSTEIATALRALPPAAAAPARAPKRR